MSNAPHRHRLQHPAHPTHQSFLRKLGVVLTGGGAVFALIGFVSFFSAFGGGGTPELFWCAFVGLPLLGVGTALLKMGYLGAVARYTAGEVAPVATDAVHFMAGETRAAVQQVAAAVGAGLRGEAALACAKCQHGNAAGARFCSQCGTSLQPANCSKCQAATTPGARFCSACGAAVVAAG